MLIDKSNKKEELENLKQIKNELSKHYSGLKTSFSSINEFFKMSEQYNELAINLSIESLEVSEEQTAASIEEINNLKFLKEENRMLMEKIETLRDQVEFYKAQSRRSNSAIQKVLKTIHELESSAANDMKTRPRPKEINV